MAVFFPDEFHKPPERAHSSSITTGSVSSVVSTLLTSSAGVHSGGGARAGGRLECGGTQRPAAAAAGAPDHSLGLHHQVRSPFLASPSPSLSAGTVFGSASAPLRMPHAGHQKVDKSIPSPSSPPIARSSKPNKSVDNWHSRITSVSYVNKLTNHAAKNSTKAALGSLTDLPEDELAESRELDLDASKKLARDYYRELFVNRYTKLRKPHRDSSDGVVDVDSVEAKEPAFFQPMKGKIANALELVKRIRSGKEFTDREMPHDTFSADEFVSKYSGEEYGRKRALERVVRIVFDLHLAVLTFSGAPDELMLRDSCLLKHAMRLRSAYTIPFMDTRLAKEAHWLMIEELPVSIAATYLELLQYSRHRLHSAFIDQLVIVDSEKKNISGEIVAFVHRKPLEASIMPSLLATHPVQKLARNFLFIMVSPVLTIISEKTSCKMRHDNFFKKLLPLLGRNGTEVKFANQSRQLTVSQVAELMRHTLKEKIIENKRAHPNADIVLIGWDTSCLLACKMAQDFPIAAVICLAFPNVTVNGIRGDVDDDLLTLNCPVLFVAGQFSTSSSIDDIQDTRDMMQCETGLVVVGGADHQLKVSSKKLQMECISQDAVDCAVLETIGDFLVFAFDRTVERGINDFDQKDPGLRSKAFAGEFFMDASIKTENGSGKRKLSSFDFEHRPKKPMARQPSTMKKSSNTNRAAPKSASKKQSQLPRIGFPSDPTQIGQIPLNSGADQKKSSAPSSSTVANPGFHPKQEPRGSGYPSSAAQSFQKQSRSVLLSPRPPPSKRQYAAPPPSGDHPNPLPSPTQSSWGMGDTGVHSRQPYHGQFWRGQRLTNSPYLEENPPAHVGQYVRSSESTEDRN